MPTLLEYINQLQREHHYRIKSVVALGDRQVESIERHMKKYDALEVGRPEKLMLQSMPPDFPGYGGHELVIIDVVTRLPVSANILENELRRILNISEGQLKVFNKGDPFDLQAEAKSDGNSEYETITGEEYRDSESNPVKANEVAGDDYVEGMLKDAAKDDRRKVVLATATDAKASGPLQNVKDTSPSPLTKTKGMK
jgi:hypothetical protein